LGEPGHSHLKPAPPSFLQAHLRTSLHSTLFYALMSPSRLISVENRSQLKMYKKVVFYDCPEKIWGLNYRAFFKFTLEKK
jgi:hypothetical protein